MDMHTTLRAEPMKTTRNFVSRKDAKHLLKMTHMRESISNSRGQFVHQNLTALSDWDCLESVDEEVLCHELRSQGSGPADKRSIDRMGNSASLRETKLPWREA